MKATTTVKMKNKKQKMSKVKSLLMHVLLCMFAFAYMEIVFHVFTYKSIDGFIIYPILFAIPVGLVIFILSSVFPEKVNKYVLWVCFSLFLIVFIAELIFEYVFKIPLLVTDIGAGNLQVVQYYREILISFVKCSPAIILSALPLILYGVFRAKGMKTNRQSWPVIAIAALMAVMFTGIALLCVNLSDKNKNIIYENYHDMYDTEQAVKSYGVITTLRLNAAKLFIKGAGEVDLDNIVIEGPAEDIDKVEDKTETIVGKDEEGNDVVIEIDTSPNMLDIDFVDLSKDGSNAKIQKINQYFASKTPTRKSEYTGMFEGYNLIYITAEAFSQYCVDEKLTPTLYKLTHNGFIFENYYAPPTGESTCGGEMMNCTGLLTNPNRPKGVYSFQQTQPNYMPYGLGNVFKRAGVTSYAYHNGSYTYYTRNKSLANLGYIYKGGTTANGSGIQAALDAGHIFKLEHPKSWPQSDLEMIQATGTEYITSDSQFHAYYMTISGHMLYSFTGNNMASKNKELVQDLPYSEACRAYIACNIELDRALEDLIRQLDEAGVLDKTVICMATDHYPYGLDEAQLNELAGKELEQSVEIYKSQLILWNSAMEEPVVVEKPCSSIDIIPTLLNLFGFEYDARLLLGSDILSSSTGFVVFPSNRCIITDTFIYSASKKKTYDLDFNPIDVADSRITAARQKGNTMLSITQLLLETNYYETVKSYIEGEE